MLATVGRSGRRGGWNPAAMTAADWNLLVGPRVTPASTITAASQLPGSGQSTGTLFDASESIWTVPCTANANFLLQAHDSVFESQINQSHGPGNFAAVSHCRFAADLQHMDLSTNNDPILWSSGMAVRNCDLITQLDGTWPGDGAVNGNPSVVEFTRITGFGAETFYGYPLASNNIPATVIGPAGTTGQQMTTAQLASQQNFTAGQVYAAGAFINPQNGYCYQVSTGGTAPSSDAGWPTAPFWQLASNSTAQPYATGPDTLEIICIGPYNHADGIQIARAGAIDIRYCYIDETTNSVIFIQSSAPSYDATPQNVPCGPIRITHCYIGGYPAQYIYVNTNAVDAVYGASIYPGRWSRSTGGTWSANATPQTGRPEMITITDNVFAPHPSGTPAGWTSQTYWPYFACGNTSLGNGGSSTFTADLPAVVPDEPTRQAGIAAQTNPDGSINTAVLEERFQTAGLFPGACDARSWIVWARNVTPTGAIVAPSPRGTSGPYSNGFYIGG